MSLLNRSHSGGEGEKKRRGGGGKEGGEGEMRGEGERRGGGGKEDEGRLGGFGVFYGVEKKRKG